MNQTLQAFEATVLGRGPAPGSVTK